MRLIDADMLKETFIVNTDRKGYLVADPEVIIDNAPTVEPCYQTTSCLDCKNYDKANYYCPRFCEVIREIAKENQRPQGEWIYGEDDCGQDGWFCSECNFFVPWYYQYYEKDVDFIRDYKACPHCLAEMITYTGKDRDTKGGEEE